MIPCETCPIAVWSAITNPESVERDRAIRADQRRLDIRELQAMSKDLEWLVNQLAGADAAADVTKATVAQVRRFARRLMDALEVGAERMSEGSAA